MATLSLNKMKSKLTTRNSFTGRAMERMTKEKLFELFNGDSNYMSWEETYIQRRFHPQQYLHKIRKQRRETFEAERNKHIMLNNDNKNLINLNSMLQNEEQHDIAIQQRFERFLSSHGNTDKPLLILDVDNTMIYTRFFSEELRIGDICTYFGANYQCVTKNNSAILKIRLTLSLEITHNQLIDVFGSERGEHFYWTSNNVDIQKYKKNNMFEYPLNSNNSVEFIACRIRKVEISGVVIQVNNMEIREEIEIDFTAANDNLNRFEPPLQRAGMLSVDFIYEGFLVRLRPNLDEFMEYIQDEYDVVLYTSANKIIYQGLLQQLHVFINETLGQEKDILLWREVLFRDDCILKYDHRGKPYHQKDLTLFACDLSRVVMVDNSPIVCHGQEPNLILISDFFGKQQVDADDELMEVYQLLDAIAVIKGDIRYFLCGLEEDDNETVDVSTEQKCFDLASKLIAAMEAYYNEKIHVFATDADGNMNMHLIDDDMMDDFELDEFKNMNENLLKYEEIFDDLQLNVVTAVGDCDCDAMEYEEIILDDMSDINNEAKYDRNSVNFGTFIPPKHSKTDSIISVRDLDVIKQEKQEIKNKKNKVSFWKDTDFANKGKAAATPTRKRKRSSILNSMAPKPSSMQMLRNNSNHEDFFVLLLQQLCKQQMGDFALDNKDILVHIQQKNKEKISEQQSEIKRLEVVLSELKREKKEKEKNEIIELRNENKRLMQELKDVGKNINALTENKNKVQEDINDVIEQKIKYIKSVHDEIEHYKQLIKQIATNNLTVTLSVE